MFLLLCRKNVCVCVGGGGGVSLHDYEYNSIVWKKRIRTCPYPPCRKLLIAMSLSAICIVIFIDKLIFIKNTYVFH